MNYWDPTCLNYTAQRSAAKTPTYFIFSVLKGGYTEDSCTFIVHNFYLNLLLFGYSTTSTLYWYWSELQCLVSTSAESSLCVYLSLISNLFFCFFCPCVFWHTCTQTVPAAMSLALTSTCWLAFTSCCQWNFVLFLFSSCRPYHLLSSISCF